MELWVQLGHKFCEDPDLSIDARVFGVHGSEEAVSDLAHKVRETEEEIAFEVLSEEFVTLPEAIVKHG